MCTYISPLLEVIKKGLRPASVGCLSPNARAQKLAAPYCLDFMNYEKQVKKLFDPNLVAEASWYVMPDE